MEMLLKQTTLVLLSVCVAATTQCTAVLNETRTRVVVPVDSALTLCYRMKSWTPKRFELYWHFNPSGPSFDNSERIFKSFILNMSNETKDTFQMYTLVNVTNNNSGWYFCRINADIPTLMSEDCNGTEVLVHVSLQDTWWLWVTVAVFGLIVLVLLVLCLLLTRQRKRRDNVVLMASSSCDLQRLLRRFASECEASGMRLSTSKSEAMVLSWKRVD
ncbi:uncharacterized protein LOC129188622 isoform X4 [Dunckerocampus dactyliophorus]|uniref:uncharacterized protein LOC129188622 isoform X4 n=1 Tax=Dunckerocampus dactyliophorus TaxID=161453 RepID=UPI002406A3DB|nr:uncharacterized protein LOC129188622 isoform X4 [Dunckerocampus dactyliophorus]